MHLYRVIEITNEEPLKIGAGGSKENQTEPTKDYIPGSTIRGTIIGQLVKKGIFNADTSKDILMKLECYNAYLYRNGHLYSPTPQHLRVNKHSWRKAVVERHLEETSSATVKVTNLAIQNENENNAKNPLEYRFSAVQGDYIVGAKVAKEYRLHHSTIRNKGKQERDNLFRYQAISKGHVFRSIIRFDPALEKIIQPLFESTLRLYLGGAKGSGYGLCYLQAIGDTLSNYQDAKQLIGLHYVSDEKSTKYLTITFLSDCIYRNDYGQPINYLPENYIEEISGCSVRLKKQYVQSSITEGYNATWRARYPKESTIKAGSVLVYEFKEEPLTDITQLSLKIERRLIGHRTQDGFGWIGVNIVYPEILRVGEEKDRIGWKKQAILSHEVERDIEPTFSIIVAGLDAAKQRWLDMVCLKTLHSSEEHEGQKYIISTKLNKTNMVHMQKVIDNLLKDLHNGRLPDHPPNVTIRDYTQDNRLCSIAGYNFMQIVNFLCANEKDEKFTRLIHYAYNILNSKKGRLFYFKAKYPEKQFIAELFSSGFYIMRRRKENE